MDQHVPLAITQGLRRRGLDVLTTQDDGSEAWIDEELLKRATELGRVIFTQDDDFLALANEWQHAGIEFAGVVFGRQLSVTTGQGIRDLEIIATVLEPGEIRNQVQFIPLH
jgi:predicted nuclease of predicted toxin-antitoxin system